MILLTILYALIGFIILVFFHELGHFVFAKLCKVGVEEFSIGMGHAIAKKRYKGTLYKIGWIPFGGYCKLKGQDDFGPVVITEEKDNFFAKPPYARFLISFGGPFFSFLLGIFLLTLGFWIQGDAKLNYTKISTSPNHSVFKDGDEIFAVNGQNVKTLDEIKMKFFYHNKEQLKISLIRDGKNVDITYVPDIRNMTLAPDMILYGHSAPVIKKVVEETPASKAELKEGDQILEINGHPVYHELALNYYVRNSSLPLKIKIKRNDQEFIKELIPTAEDGRNFIGVFTEVKRDLTKHIEKIDYDFKTALKRSFDSSINIIRLSYKGIVYLVRNDIGFKESTAGPIQLFSSMGEAGSKGGFFAFLSFAAFISIALAFFNFLPFPALDGGHMVFSIYEMIFKRRVNIKVVSFLQIFGIIVLIGLLVLVSVNDVMRMFKKF